MKDSLLLIVQENHMLTVRNSPTLLEEHSENILHSWNTWLAKPKMVKKNTQWIWTLPTISTTLKLKKLFILKISLDHGINALSTIPLPTANHGLITFNQRHPYGSIQFWKLLELEWCSILEIQMVLSVLLEADNGLRNSTGQLNTLGNHG